MPADVDTTDALKRFARELEDGADGERRQLILEILARWATDLDLNARSRDLAGELSRRFARLGPIV